MRYQDRKDTVPSISLKGAARTKGDRSMLKCQLSILTAKLPRQHVKMRLSDDFNVIEFQELSAEFTFSPTSVYLQSACLKFSHRSNQILRIKYYPLTLMLNQLAILNFLTQIFSLTQITNRSKEIHLIVTNVKLPCYLKFTCLTQILIWVHKISNKIPVNLTQVRRTNF